MSATQNLDSKFQPEYKVVELRPKNFHQIAFCRGNYYCVHYGSRQ